MGRGLRIGHDAMPEWRPAAGDVGVISASGVLNDIRPAIQSWVGSETWKTSNNYQFSTIPGFCGGAWCDEIDTWFAMGGGHASYCVPAPYMWKTSTLAWSWGQVPLPTDGFDAAITAGGVDGAVATARANAATAYGATFDSATDWEWLGSASEWGAAAQTGVIQPEPSHSYYGNVYIPGSSAGNTNGILLKLYPGSGRGPECLVPTRHYWDFDDSLWKHTTNYRSNPSAAAGGSVYFGGSIDRVFSLTNTSGGTWRNEVDMLVPSTLTWSTKATGNNALLQIYSGGLLAFLPGSLLIHVLPATGQTAYVSGVSIGDATYVNATQHQFYALDAALLKAGSSPSWAKLTISNPGGTWPLRLVGGAGTNNGQNTWAYCPTNQCYYAVNGLHNSTSIWKLTPPTGCTTAAEYIAGTWVVSEEALATAIPSGSTGSATGSTGEPFNRLQWSSTAGCFLWFDAWISNKPVAIRPAGV